MNGIHDTLYTGSFVRTSLNVAVIVGFEISQEVATFHAILRKNVERKYYEQEHHYDNIIQNITNSPKSEYESISNGSINIANLDRSNSIHKLIHSCCLLSAIAKYVAKDNKKLLDSVGSRINMTATKTENLEKFANDINNDIASVFCENTSELITSVNLLNDATDDQHENIAVLKPKKIAFMVAFVVTSGICMTCGWGYFFYVKHKN
jgi:hypothetical protein